MLTDFRRVWKGGKVRAWTEKCSSPLPFTLLMLTDFRRVWKGGKVGAWTEKCSLLSKNSWSKPKPI